MTETITVIGISGRRKYRVPAGWKWDKTARHVWVRLYWLTKETDPNTRIKRAEFSAKRETLAQVLADSLGMGSTYWLMAAQNIASDDQT